MEQRTEATTVHCAARCGHTAHFEDQTPAEIASALAFAGWVNGVCAECAAMGIPAASHRDESLRIAEAVCGGRR